MKILVVGSGGREHALAWKLKQSKAADEIFLAPGNAGTAREFVNVDIDVMDFESLHNFCTENLIDLMVVGPENPLCFGIVDYFAEHKSKTKVFGPNRAAARFEGSKDFTKNFLHKYDIPTAKSKTFTDYKTAVSFFETVDPAAYPLVIKADGLCKGKGVSIVNNFAEAKQTVEDILLNKIFGAEGDTIVVEEYLAGEEQSLLCFVSNNHLVPMDSARDYKKIFDHDMGPNTGGVGAYSPMPANAEALAKNIQVTLRKIEAGFDAEGIIFNGILFIGFMIQGTEAKVLEFNVRFGDPETEVLLPRLYSDLLAVMQKTLSGELKAADLHWKDEFAVAVVLYEEGYPAEYKKGVVIEALPEFNGKDEILFHNGTKFTPEGNLANSGGRVLTAVALGATKEAAREKAYQMAKKIKSTGLRFRTDIAL